MRKPHYLASFTLLAACGTDPAADSAIHAELEPLAGLSYDSGAIPSGSPVTIDLKASAGGKLTLDAPAQGPGQMAVDAHVSLGATIASTIPGAEYNGPLQGAPALDIKIAGDTMFDPSAVGTPAKLDAMIPAADLATIPLAAALGVPGVTGDLTIKLQGGTVTSVFTATCANAGHFAGTIDISGTVTLGGSLKVSVPLVGDTTLDLGALAIAVPAIHKLIAFTTPQDPQATGCSGGGGSGSAGSGTGGGSGSGSGSGSGGASPDELWNVTIESATFGTDYNGGNWDPGGAPDPFVVVNVGTNRRQMTTVKADQTGSATWHETLGPFSTSEIAAYFDVMLIDQDSNASDFVSDPGTFPDFDSDNYMAWLAGMPPLDGLTHTYDASWDPGGSWKPFAGSVTFTISKAQ